MVILTTVVVTVSNTRTWSFCQNTVETRMQQYQMYLTQSIKLNQVCDKLMEPLHKIFQLELF